MSPGKIRASVVADKTAVVRRMLDGIASLPLASEQEFLADPRMVAAGESYLRRGLEALFDIGRHLLAKAFADPAAEYEHVAERLGAHGVLDAEHVARLRVMAGYRNRLVHVYAEVTPAELYAILTRHGDDVLDLLDALRQWMAAHPEMVDESL
jgi:uncharacterized protein YutE (UPF0331/DUF86 family)